MKHKIRSRVLTVMLSLMFIVGLMPATVFAANTTTLNVNGTNILTAPDYKVVCGSGTATYDPGTNTLTLDNAEINYQQNSGNNGAGAILFDGDLNINLVGENTITSVTCGILGKNAGTLTITGDSLTLDCIYYGIARYSAGADITIDGADIDVTAKGADNFTGVGIQASGVLSIKNGAYIDATDVSHHPIIGNAGIEIEDSTVYAQQYTDYYAAIRSDSEISISNSTVEAKADSEGSSAIWTGNDLSSTFGNITISNGSDVTLYSKSSNAVYAMLGTISISGSTVKAESFSGAYPTLCADGDIDITDHSDVTVKSADTIGIYSTGGAVEIQDSIAHVTAHDEWDAIRGNDGGAAISGSWVETFGSMVSQLFTHSDSAIFLNNEGEADGSLILPGDVTVSKDMILSVPEDSSITVPDGVIFTNHGQIELLGELVVNDGAIVCDSHSGGTATCIEKAKCSICGKEYGDLGSHVMKKTEAKKATCTEDGNTEYYTCEICGKIFSDKNGLVEIQLSDTVIKAKGHSYENGRCTLCGAAEGSAQTGDDSSIVSLAILAGIAALGIAGTALYRKRREIK
ncbi:hypothetical protein [Gallibacter sp. Marseille-QA0791]|uniref:hypothetical protein n=1 Tax=Gallibacter sp. Marseille-QA0791 TaxID=3378781 RepID=UPI003D0F2130